MTGSNNSAKRDRLSVADVQKIIAIEARTGVYPASWYAKDIWEYIKANYQANPQKVPGVYRDGLKQNMTNFMHLLYKILKETGESGQDLLAEFFLQPHDRSFEYDYEFNQLGEITKQIPRHKTERSRDEIARYRRVAFASVIEYVEKENRNGKPTTSRQNQQKIADIVSKIKANAAKDEIKTSILEVMTSIQADIIASF